MEIKNIFLTKSTKNPNLNSNKHLKTYLHFLKQLNNFALLIQMCSTALVAIATKLMKLTSITRCITHKNKN